MAKKSRPDETVSFTLPDGGFRKEPAPVVATASPLNRRVDELFGQYFAVDKDPPRSSGYDSSCESGGTGAALVAAILADLLDRVGCISADQEQLQQEAAAEKEERRSRESCTKGKVTVAPGLVVRRSVESSCKNESGTKHQENRAASPSLMGVEPVVVDVQRQTGGDSSPVSKDGQSLATAATAETTVKAVEAAVDDDDSSCSLLLSSSDGRQQRRQLSSLSESCGEESPAQQLARRNRMKHTGER